MGNSTFKYWQERLIREIETCCTDPDFFEIYKEKYLPLGEAIGMSRQKVEALIRSNLKLNELEELFEESSEEVIPSDNETIDSTPPELIYDEAYITSKLQSKYIIERILHKDRTWLIEVKNRVNGRESILRFMDRPQYETSYGKNLLIKLHEQEKKAFSPVYNIQEEEFGAYYTKAKPEGKSLDKYITQTNLNRTADVGKLKKKDFALIYCLLEYFNNIRYPLEMVKPDLIYVEEFNKSPLTSRFNISSVIDGSEFSSKDDMNEKVHNMLGSLLYPGLYKSLRSMFYF